ncbi:hypothetical protein MKK63_16975 [Methylobacterium sp. J-088]|uniref:hypothetical protein n=1 Tax=Methylobacterium sp. J-088 TaxID=2836664 RepID=UPI001FB94964|nr:hypothetical protein [Methylobacterium sp. J-088]MCJ2064395.1 hypothetical protein [Methylobacterium sp. J-088]
MDSPTIFVSVGISMNPKQETFVRAVEDRLRSEGLSPRTVGRNTFSAGSPFIEISKLLDRSAGVVVIALERYRFENGVEKRGSAHERQLQNVKLPTVWNQIEAALAYGRNLPLIVIADNETISEGLLQTGYDWFVMRVKPELSSLQTDEFNGVLADWKTKVISKGTEVVGAQGASKVDPANLTIGVLISSLKPAQFWGVLVALGALLGVAFAGGKLLSVPPAETGANVSSQPQNPAETNKTK